MEEERVMHTIKKVMPAVVSITVSKKAEDVERDIPDQMIAAMGGGKKGSKHIHIPQELIDKNGMVNVGGGSGFIVKPNGIIVTNKHVVAEPHASYTVVLNDGQHFPATILTRDPIHDVAILQIEATGLPVVHLGKASDLELGRGVVAIGNALGLFQNTVSLGIISGLSRAIMAQADPTSAPQELRGLIQTDAAINPGNSGGPLVNLDGLAIGINAAIVFGAQNIGFAIPIRAVERDLEDLNTYGRVRRPLLGIRYIVIDDKVARSMNLPIEYGALVTGEHPHDAAVVPNSPAAHAGIREGDIILTCNGKKVEREHPVQDALENAEVGDILHFTFWRSGKTHTASVTLTERK